MYNDYFVENFGDREDRFIPVCLTTVNIDSHDTTYTLFKRKNKSLLCINKDYIDMLADTPLSLTQTAELLLQTRQLQEIQNLQSLQLLQRTVTHLTVGTQIKSLQPLMISIQR